MLGTTLQRFRPAFFLDRDGTIIEFDKDHQIVDPSEIKFLPNVLKALKKIQDNNYKIIIITNQPRIAWEELTIEQLNNQHNRILEIAKENGVIIDDILYCPHYFNPESGVENKWTINCDCRKPRSGLFSYAAKLHNIDIRESIMIGDQQKDVEAGIRAGCKMSWMLDDSHDLLYFVNLILG